MDDLLCHTDSLINHVYWFKQDLQIKPTKDHFGTAINWTDIEDRKHDFLKELVNTVTGWVYSHAKAKEIIENRLSRTNGDYPNAATFLTTQAFSKFRPGHPQGQFGELLLFNFIQHFFKALPLLRKQRITTSVGHERFGADAVHYKKTDSANLIFLGESKCYESSYQFKKAFETSLNSIVTTVKNFNKELDLYTYEDFIDSRLEEVAKKYKENTLENVRFELICLIAYNETKIISGLNETEIKQSIKSIIEERCIGLDATCFDSIEDKILSRINYVVFPIWDLDKLLESFQKQVGST